MNLLNIFIYFWIMSTIGWIMEVIVCSVPEHKFINRGFLIGPYCPIYGFGGLILLVLAPFKNNWLLVFGLSLFLCTILEYFTSYIMELIFKVRWWDYSNDFLNINGRVCLRNALAFGFLGVISVCFLNPYIMGLINQINYNILIIMAICLLIITVLDIFMSFNVMKNIKSTVSKLNNKVDATNDIKKLIKDSLLKKDYLYRRFINSYNRFEYYYDELKNKLNNYRNKELALLQIKNGRRLLLFILLGIIASFILGYIINNYKKSFIICLSISLLINTIYDRINDRSRF